MKHKNIILLSTFLLFLISIPLFSAMTINFQNNFGWTWVDVGDAMGFPEGAGVTRWLNDYDQFNYRGSLQIFFDDDPDAQLQYGLECGFNRLYYWLEKSQPIGQSTPYWYNGTIWTFQLGALAKYKIEDGLYALFGLSAHQFLNGSGLTLGIPIGIQKEYKLSEQWSLPLELRADWIFGNDTPVAIGAGFGLKYRFE
jgi:hypothetical protein